uniref:Transcription factor CBF/NF-Y/archaeal histone domain-containing protein n=1 Tax=Panagrolaimus sp. PS1159 TaxID=55785 RepID=A0AC35EXC9_9BILA
MSMVNREMVVKMIQSICAHNTIDPDATQRLYECTMVLAEKVLDYAVEAAKLRNSDKIEKCDIKMAITLIKQA